MFSRSRRRSFISMLIRVSKSLRVRSLPISLPSSAHSPSVQMQYCSVHADTDTGRIKRVNMFKSAVNHHLPANQDRLSSVNNSSVERYCALIFLPRTCWVQQSWASRQGHRGRRRLIPAPPETKTDNKLFQNWITGENETNTLWLDWREETGTI